MNDNILVTVLMSVYNESQYIKEAVDSILNQTYKNFEFLIFDDASTDNTREILNNIRDDRIKLICNKKNSGLTENLNQGIILARGKYIVRMDGDDISCPDRLERQILFMENNQDICLASCGFFILKDGNEQLVSQILTLSEIQVRLLFNTVLPHPGFIIRRENIVKAKIRYNNKLRYAQDYDFQVRISKLFKVALMPEALFKYRVTNTQISVEKYDEQQKCANITRLKQLREMGIFDKQVNLTKWGRFCMNEFGKLSYRDLLSCGIMEVRIIRNNQLLDKSVLTKYCIEKIWMLFKQKILSKRSGLL